MEGKVEFTVRDGKLYLGLNIDRFSKREKHLTLAKRLAMICVGTYRAGFKK